MSGGEIVSVADGGTRDLKRTLARVGGLFRGGPRELMVATERRVPFLDALRSLAVLLVINAHVSTTFATTYAPNLFTKFPVTANGWMGVDLFFVLSGYFIGSQLWRELNRSGTISMGRFVIRRGLRIWPLYLFIFAVITIVLHGGTAARQYGWTDLVFITNYLNHGIVSGSWSLCSEEQFYLLTPATLLLFGRRSMRGYRWGLGVLLALICLVRWATYFELTGHLLGRYPLAFQKLYYPFHTHCDGLIAGLFVANLMTSKEKLKGLLRRPRLLVVLSVLLVGVMYGFHVEAEQFLGLAVFFAAVVWWGLQSGTMRFGQHIYYLLSRLSFGMYLNHEYMQHWIVGRVLPGLGLLHLGSIAASILGFLLLSACSAGLSAVTFCLVEHPFLMIRTAVLGRKSVSPLVAH